MVHVACPIRPEARRAIAKIGELSGQNVHLCMQCGTCSAVCPMVPEMGITTRQAMHELQFGRPEKVLAARVGEFCASCHACEVRCPRGIEVPKVFEAVRLMVLRSNQDLVDLGAIPAETLEEAPQIAMVSAFRKLTA